MISSSSALLHQKFTMLPPAIHVSAKKVFYRKGQRPNNCCVNILEVRLCSGEWLWGHLQSFKQRRAYSAPSLGFPGGDYSKLKSCSHGQCFDGPAVRTSITEMGWFGFGCPGAAEPRIIQLQTLHRLIINIICCLTLSEIKEYNDTEVSSSSSHGWFHIFVLLTKSFLCLFLSLKFSILFFQIMKPLCKGNNAVERRHSRSLWCLGVFHVIVFFLAVNATK